MSTPWRITITATARAHLQAVSDPRIRAAIVRRIDDLKHDPEKQGKPLHGDLRGYYSVRAASQRYRIIYQIDRGAVIVCVVALGIRKEGDKGDIYTLAQRLFNKGLLIPDPKEE